MALLKKKGGLYLVGIDTKRFGRRWLETGASTLRQAEELVRAAKVPDLEAADKVSALTADTLSSIMSGKRLTCAELLTAWKEWRRLDSASPNTVYVGETWIRLFLDRYNLHEKQVSFITRQMVFDFINSEDSGTRSTRMAKLSALRSLFSYAVSQALVVANPTAKMRVSHKAMTQEERTVHSRVPFTQAEYRQLTAKATGFWKVAIELGYWAGLRISDIALLEWSSLANGMLSIWTEKRDELVRLPIDSPILGGGRLHLALIDLVPNQNRYVFPEQATLQQDVKRRATLSVQFGRLCESLGIEGKSFHCFRHGFVQRLDAQGIDLAEVSKLVGHGNSKSTFTYVDKTQYTTRKGEITKRKPALAQRPD